MVENKILIFQVLNSADWLKLYVDEFHTPTLVEKMNGSLIYYCFACGGRHLFFCVSDEPLDLHIPRECIESLNVVEVACWGEMMFDEFYIELMILTKSGYKEE